MNNPDDHSTDYSEFDPVSNAPADLGAELDQCVRRNPGGSLLVALGLGLALGILVRGLRPEPRPQHRLAELLEDLEERVRETSAPAFRQASKLASESAQVLGSGLHRGEAQLERVLRQTARRLRGFWS